MTNQTAKATAKKRNVKQTELALKYQNAHKSFTAARKSASVACRDAINAALKARRVQVAEAKKALKDAIATIKAERKAQVELNKAETAKKREALKAEKETKRAAKPKAIRPVKVKTKVKVEDTPDSEIDALLKEWSE